MTPQTYPWVKSSYSSQDGGNCVEWSPAHACAHGTVPVRDSKAPAGPALMFEAGCVVRVRHRHTGRGIARVSTYTETQRPSPGIANPRRGPSRVEARPVQSANAGRTSAP